ncbi:RdgB/HAM1 family non-canonical purine NTP pyrophosphatase [Catenovulum adriaticum]|uniref:dITP/XTP pyrophosphatase n=1 Tax=Catenovulum adriaticum TaxID=2984846 RepID=A0ABY7ASJ5_9ALTE|nr:RdgB/HAM1 family non-canonical purine NTP pyrophosphatase [Catenovulum sp. TS8]WAJ72500.1 RdgB/HAM1 family non-canonical purine NTP pyrophosphatase [Catenovulum sp. TS8]
MQKIVLATGNQGKVKELNQMLATANIEIIAQTKLNVVEAEETGLSFIENAILKARNACQQTGLPAIADDSGLEVDYLKGAPGIYSSRYAGVSASDQQNLEKLLNALKSVPESQRTAKFQCVLVYMRHEYDPTPIICQGSWAGRITTQAYGDNGFGYDPIFWVSDHNCTSAQLDSSVKNKISHRAKALAQLKQLDLRVAP